MLAKVGRTFIKLLIRPLDVGMRWTRMNPSRQFEIQLAGAL
jgi:hypothetical protein